jgi:hypothetical protein
MEHFIKKTEDRRGDAHINKTRPMTATTTQSEFGCASAQEELLLYET